MKAKIIIFIITLFVLVSCEKLKDVGRLNIGQEINFKIGETIYSSNNSMSLKVIEVNDSRCPSDVTCVWEGEAKVKFNFENNNSNEFILSTLFPKSDTIDNYIIRLIDVTPYPISTKEITLEEYSVKVQLEPYYLIN